jgi:uncharacterized protein
MSKKKIKNTNHRQRRNKIAKGIEEEIIRTWTTTIDPSISVNLNPKDSSILGYGISNNVLDPKGSFHSNINTNFPPLATPEEIKLLNEVLPKLDQIYPKVAEEQEEVVRKLYAENPVLRGEKIPPGRTSEVHTYSPVVKYNDKQFNMPIVEVPAKYQKQYKSWSETIIVTVSGVSGPNNTIVSALLTKAILCYANIVPESFSSTVDVILNPVNGMITLPAGTPLNYNNQNGIIPDAIKIDVRYDYLINNSSIDIDIKDNIIDNAWIQTFSGRKIIPQNINTGSIVIQDISHALSNKCIFEGHTNKFFSIAQSSVLISYVCNKKNALFGLLKYANKAYIPEFPSYLEKLPIMATLRTMEAEIQNAIYLRFGLPLQKSEDLEDIKQADDLVASTELSQLMQPLHSDWKINLKPLPFTLTPLVPLEAEKLFLDRFDDLFGQLNANTNAYL